MARRAFLTMLLIMVASVAAVAQVGVRGVAKSATWTTATALNTILSYDLTNTQYEGVYVFVSGGANITAGAVTFESGPTSANITTTQLTRTDASTNDGTYTLVASTKQGWTGSVGPPYFQARLSTAITASSGVASTTITIIPYSFPSPKDVAAASSYAAQPVAANLNATVTNLYGNGTQILPTDVVLNIPVGGTIARGVITSAMTGTTSTSAVAGLASNYLYVQWCIPSNTHASVGTEMLMQDGSGGTTIGILPAPSPGSSATSNSTGVSGAMTIFPSPVKVPTLGNALYVANVTTGSSTKITCGGFYSTVSY